ncbi:MAG: hypothetical protein ACH346_03005 [Chthoniobacterales bacterium]
MNISSSLLSTLPSNLIKPGEGKEITVISNTPLSLAGITITPCDNSETHQKLLEAVALAKENYDSPLTPHAENSVKVVESSSPIVKKRIIEKESQVAAVSAQQAKNTSEGTKLIANRLHAHLSNNEDNKERLECINELVSNAQKAAHQANYIASLAPYSESIEAATFLAKLTAFDEKKAKVSFAKVSLIEAELNPDDAQALSSSKTALNNAEDSLDHFFKEIKSLGVSLNTGLNLRELKMLQRPDDERLQSPDDDKEETFSDWLNPDFGETERDEKKAIDNDRNNVFSDLSEITTHASLSTRSSESHLSDLGQDDHAATTNTGNVSKSETEAILKKFAPEIEAIENKEAMLGEFMTW